MSKEQIREISGEPYVSWLVSYSLMKQAFQARKVQLEQQMGLLPDQARPRVNQMARTLIEMLDQIRAEILAGEYDREGKDE